MRAAENHGVGGSTPSLATLTDTHAAAPKPDAQTRALQQGESHFKAGEYDAAKIEYLKVLRLDSGNALAYARCGTMWAAEGAPLRAGAFLMKAKEFTPKDLDNRYSASRMRSRMPSIRFSRMASAMRL